MKPPRRHAAMAFTRDDLERLDAAIASGVAEVEQDQHSQRMRRFGMAGLLEARHLVDRQLSGLSGWGQFLPR